MKETGINMQTKVALITIVATLVVIGIMGMTIGKNVLFADIISRDKTAEFKQCKADDFKTSGCEKYWDRINTDVSGIYVDLKK